MAQDATGSIPIQPSCSLRVVHFSESLTEQPTETSPSKMHYPNNSENLTDGVDEETFSFYRSQSVGSKMAEEGCNRIGRRQQQQQQQQRQHQHQPESNSQKQYSSMYLCPQDSYQLLTHSSPSSPAGSNASIVGSLISHASYRNYCCVGVSGHHHHCASKVKNHSTTSTSSGSSNWKIRNRFYSKRKGQERSTDRERQASICSDSETDSITGQMASILNCSNSNTKKWSLPLPMVIPSSESDSASSSWSARSADEATEDERSPVPSPSASTHSNDDYLGGLPEITCNTSQQQQQQQQQPSESSNSRIIMETNKLAVKTSTEKAGQSVNLKKNQQQPGNITTDLIQANDSEIPVPNNKEKVKTRARKKKMSRAAESHDFQRMKTTNYGRCIICDAYVYFWGFECTQCQLICHKKCLKKMAIVCPKQPLPPRSSILNVDLETLVCNEHQQDNEHQQAGQEGMQKLAPEDLVPLLLKKCTDEIERRCITRPGIYRMTGVASRVEKLLKSFESGPHLIDLTDVSVNDLTSVLKVFLRELKQPLITNDVYKDFIDIGRLYRSDESLLDDGITMGGHSPLILKLHQAIGKLSKCHLATLKHICRHLNRVASFQEQNNMSPAALGIIFAPTIFRPRDQINDLYTEVFEAAPQARIIELLIRFYTPVFELETDYIDEPIQSPIMSTIQKHPASQQKLSTDTDPNSWLIGGENASSLSTTTCSSNPDSSTVTWAQSLAKLESLSSPLTLPPSSLTSTETDASTTADSQQQQRYHHQQHYHQSSKQTNRRGSPLNSSKSVAGSQPSTFTVD